jgi:hypothetical protein
VRRIRFDRSLPMHLRERNLAVPAPVTRLASRCRPPSPFCAMAGSGGGAFPGRVRFLTSFVALEAPPTSGPMPLAAYCAMCIRLAPTHTAVNLENQVPTYGGGLDHSHAWTRRLRRAVPERSRALESVLLACDRDSLRLRTSNDASLRWRTISRSNVTSPRGPCSACNAVHEEPSSFCRRREVLPPRVSHPREPAMRCVRPTCAHLSE